TCFILFTAPPHPAIAPLSLHDALPIFTAARPGSSSRTATSKGCSGDGDESQARSGGRDAAPAGVPQGPQSAGAGAPGRAGHRQRSEEHTSELQSRSDLVCRLLLEKKKQ